MTSDLDFSSCARQSYHMPDGLNFEPADRHFDATVADLRALTVRATEVPWGSSSSSSVSHDLATVADDIARLSKLVDFSREDALSWGASVRALGVRPTFNGLTESYRETEARLRQSTENLEVLRVGLRATFDFENGPEAGPPTLSTDSISRLLVALAAKLKLATEQIEAAADSPPRRPAPIALALDAYKPIIEAKLPVEPIARDDIDLVEDKHTVRACLRLRLTKDLPDDFLVAGLRGADIALRKAAPAEAGFFLMRVVMPSGQIKNMPPELDALADIAARGGLRRYAEAYKILGR